MLGQVASLLARAARAHRAQQSIIIRGPHFRRPSGGAVQLGIIPLYRVCRLWACRCTFMRQLCGPTLYFAARRVRFACHCRCLFVQLGRWSPAAHSSLRPACGDLAYIARAFGVVTGRIVVIMRRGYARFGHHQLSVARSVDRAARRFIMHHMPLPLFGTCGPAIPGVGCERLWRSGLPYPSLACQLIARLVVGCYRRWL